MRFSHRTVDLRKERGRVGFRNGARYFGGNPDPFHAVLDRGECNDAAFANLVDLLRERGFDILRIVVLSADDDQVLHAPGDEQFAIDDTTEVAGAQPTVRARVACLVRIARIACDKRLGARFLITPVPACYARSVDPDFANPRIAQHGLRSRVDDEHAVRVRHPAATDQRDALGRFVERALAERLRRGMTYLHAGAGLRTADQQRRFRQTVAGKQRVGVEILSAELGGELQQRFGANRLRAAEREAPAIELDAVELRAAYTVRAQLEREIRAAADRAAIGRDRFQPANRGFEKMLRRQQYQRKAAK